MKELRIITNSQSRVWDEFILSSGKAGPYLLNAWGQAVKKAYGHRTFNIMSFGHDGKATGALPLVLVKAPFIKGSLVSLPFCDYGGIISTDEESFSGLVDFASDLASSLDARLEIRSAVEIPVLKEKLGMGAISHKVRMILELAPNSQMLWDGFKSKLRSQIKKPAKEGLEFKLGGMELIDDFYSVFRINMHDLGSPVHSKRWIKSIIEFMGHTAHVGVVYKDAYAIGGGIILESGDMITIPWASTLASYSRLSPNMMLYWGFLQFTCDNGFKYFDFGRSTPGEGTYRFKEQWGAMPQSLFWYGEGFRDEPEQSTTQGSMREKAALAWTRLPQGLADLAGPMLRRYISL
jgi:FemAB-related protein (PEP-CTERM system-associated)